MEEKERYELVEEDFAYAIVDNEEHKTYQQDCFDFGNICDLLNQQDKRIKELKEENKELVIKLDKCETGIISATNLISYFVNENQQLKQPLHELLKKIMEDIRTDIFGSSIDVEMTKIDRILDTILKKYGG